MQNKAKKPTTVVEHICGNVVYKTCSNPSGRFLTTVINSIVTVLMLMYTCLKKTGDIELAKSLLTKARVYGDDHVVFFHKDHVPFDMLDIVEAAKEIGLKYTGVEKTKETPRWYKFDEVKYLQRYFIRDENGKFHAALDKAVISEIGQWIPRGQPKRKVLHDCFVSMLHEAFHWGPEYYSEVNDLVKQYCNQHRIEKPVLFYDDLYAKFTQVKREHIPGVLS